MPDLPQPKEGAHISSEPRRQKGPGETRHQVQFGGASVDPAEAHKKVEKRAHEINQELLRRYGR